MFHPRHVWARSTRGTSILYRKSILPIAILILELRPSDPVPITVQVVHGTFSSYDPVAAVLPLNERVVSKHTRRCSKDLVAYLKKGLLRVETIHTGSENDLPGLVPLD